MKKYISDFRVNKTSEKILALFFSLSLIVGVYLLLPPSYSVETNDDSLIAMYLAGYRLDGTPSSFAFFLNPMMTKFLAFLYKLVGGVHWYAWMHIISLFFSITIIEYYLFRELTRANLSIWTIVNLGVFIFLVFFFYPVVWMTFSLSSVVLITAVIVMELCEDTFVLGLFFLKQLMLFWAFCWRWESACIALAFYVYILVYKIIKGKVECSNNNTIQKYLLNFLCIAVIVIVAMSCRKCYQRQNAEYFSFNAARASYVDYAHLNYKDFSDVYEGVGIDISLYTLLQDWYFMDESINVDSLEQISVNRFSNNNMLEPIVTVVDVVNESLLIKSCIFIYLFLIVSYVGITKSHSEWFDVGATLLLGIATILGATLISLTGRFPKRVAVSVIIPPLMISLFVFIRNTGKINELWECFWKRRLYLLVTIVTIVVALNDSAFIDAKKVKENRIERQEFLERLAVNNPDNLYIYDYIVPQFIDAFPDYDNGYPINLIHWGGWYMYSEPYYKQLKLNGIEDMKTELFLDENVLLVTTDDDWPAKKYARALKNRIDYLTGNETFYSREDVGGGIVIWNFYQY